MSHKCYCDVCKKEFNEYDMNNRFKIFEKPGYGSQFDGEIVDIDLCNECFDSLMLHVLLPSIKADSVVTDGIPHAKH